MIIICNSCSPYRVVAIKVSNPGDPEVLHAYCKKCKRQHEKKLERELCSASRRKK